MAEDAPTLLSINARDPDGLDTSWLYDVDFSPLRGRHVLITGDRAMDLAVRLEVNGVSFAHVTGFGKALAAVPPGRLEVIANYTASRTSERSWTVSTESALRVVWVYPDLLSTYGDRGNMLILEHRARARGLRCRPSRSGSTRRCPPRATSTCSAAARTGPQALAAQRLNADQGLHRAVDRAPPCSPSAPATSWSARPSSPRAPSAAGSTWSDLRSDRGATRAVGEIVGTPDPALGLPAITGFENHGGRTHLGVGARPLARVSTGIGNDGITEGVWQGRLLGTYMHGPALARNPALADLLLTWATGAELPPLDDTWPTRLRQERLAATATSAPAR
jgi:CobQ-like glutamine amidotransferase family enzyme